MEEKSETVSQEMTIDELAAVSGASTRTIRYYQAKGLLRRPSRCGRVAHYDEEHRDRLVMIEELKSRGLTLRAIKDLVRHSGMSNEPLEAWLELDRLRGCWSKDAPRALTREELNGMIGREDASTINRLVDAGIVELDPSGGDRRYVVDAPTLLGHALELEAAGVALDISAEVHEVLQRHFRSAVRDVLALLESRRGCGFGSSESPDDMERAIAAMVPAGDSNVIRQIFSRSVEQGIAQWLEEQAPKELGKRRRNKRRS